MLAVRLEADGVRKGSDVADVTVSAELRARGRALLTLSIDEGGIFT
jgi:hypothetical protein